MSLLLAMAVALVVTVGGGALQARAAARSARINVVLVQAHALDCEAAALEIALSAVGVTATQDGLVASMGADLRAPVVRNGLPVAWGDPYSTFVGNINGRMLVTGYGVYYPPVVAAAHVAGANAFGEEGAQPAALYAAVAAGDPVVVWAPHLMALSAVGVWTAWDGRAVWYSSHEHAQVLIGFDYNAATVTLADPLDGRVYTYPMSLFESRFSTFHSMAVVVSRTNGPAPITTSRSGDQTLFWKGMTQTLYEAWTTNGSWSPPVAVAGAGAAPMASEPAAAVTASGQQIVFWEGKDGLLWEMWWDGPSGWHGPVPVGPGFAMASAPSVIVTASNQTVFWESPSGQLEETWWTARAGWAGPMYVPGAVGMLSSPSAINSTATEQTVFWRGSNGELEESWWIPGGGWNGPVPVAGGAMAMATAPSAVVLGNGRQVVFWQAAGASLREATWRTAGWSAAADDGMGPLGSAPGADVTATGVQSVFWKGTDANVWTTANSGGSWSVAGRIGLGPLG